MNILVTGGAGYIGSVVTRKLLEKNHSVTILDNLSTGHADTIPSGATFIEGSVSELTTHVSREDNIEAVIHLAASISAGESTKEPNMYWQNNFVETLEMLKGMQNLDIQKLVFASTAAVYGNSLSVPIEEDSPKNPTNPYGMTKLAMDMAITSQSTAYGLAATSVRFFNVAGAYKGSGERHPDESHLIPLAFDAATGEKDLTLFGTDYDTKDGTCVRDYIHVADLADAIELSLENLKPQVHTIYNLGNGIGFTNKEVIETVKQVTGKNFHVSEAARRDGDPANLVASSEKAHKELGWTPTITSLEEIVRDAWEFYVSTHSIQQ
jgi:UDP-glucose 4-epimerase